jgi:hypothetical protein
MRPIRQTLNGRLDRDPYNRGFAAHPTMEADRLNLIQNSLQDLAARTAELRRYL